MARSRAPSARRAAAYSNRGGRIVTTASGRTYVLKPKDTRVRHGGHGFRQVNAPKRLF